jgi:hypothetical protein
MIERSCIYKASLGVAAILLAASTAASAQDINFACYGPASGGAPTSTVMDTGLAGNLCAYTGVYNVVTNPNNPTDWAVPQPDNDRMFQSYTNAGFTVTDITNNVSLGFGDNAYNEENGNVLTTLGAYTRPLNISPLQATPSPPAVPSLDFGRGSAGKGFAPAGTISVQSTTPGGLFTFDAVDLLNSSGSDPAMYTITGKTNNVEAFSFSGYLNIANCPTQGAPNSYAGCLYQSIDNPSSNVKIDELDISITDSGKNGLTRLDNIQLLPEGGEGFMYLLLACGACFAAMVFSARNQVEKHDAV